jgi:hypothetical protein
MFLSAGHNPRREGASLIVPFFLLSRGAITPPVKELPVQCPCGKVERVRVWVMLGARLEGYRVQIKRTKCLEVVVSPTLFFATSSIVSVPVVDVITNERFSFICKRVNNRYCQAGRSD